MKYIILALSIVAISLQSCRRVRQCNCIGKVNSTVTMDALSAKNSESKCDEIEKNFGDSTECRVMYLK